MRFYVIAMVDMTREYHLTHRRPRGRAWQITEGDEQAEYGYLGPEWRNHKHRKYVAEAATRAQLEQCIDALDLWPEETETMGSLTGIGWLPAIAFSGEQQYEEGQNVITSAYVTPLLEPVRPRVNGETERDWERVRRAMLRKYGNG
jgi:hypothetical protein